MSRQLARVALLAVALHAVAARAEEAEPSMFSFGGFGTVGVVHSSESQADYAGNFFKPSGAGFSSAWSMDVDSLIGAQVTANFTSQLSAVLQVVSEQNHDNSYKPHLEWANIKYQFTPDFSLRVGRTVLPAYLLSDTQKVGYTYPWVRLPLEVYDVLPITTIDGVDASYRLHFGEVTNTVQVKLGQRDKSLINNGGSVMVRNYWSITNTAESGPLTLRATYQVADLSIPSLNALFDVFRQFGPQGVALADRYDSRAKPASFLAIGVSYDPGRWFAMAEWAGNNTHSSLGRRRSWYVSGGYHFGQLTPYITYAQARADDLSDPGLNTAVLPPFLVGPATGLNAALNAILGSKPVLNTVTIGGRWDFMRNAALKLQFDHSRIGAGSNGLLKNTQPGFQAGGKVSVFSATVDFVF